LGAAPIRINSGGNAFVDSLGNSWLGDSNYNTGNKYATGAAIVGSPSGLPYNSERWDASSGSELMYSFLLDPGPYQVRLHFAEIYSGASQVGQRVFDVLIEGQLVLDDFDMVATAGFQTAIVEEFEVTLVDDTLNIQFLHGVENPKISGIEIIPGPITAPVLDASPSSLGFGSVQVGASSAGQTVTLTNTGDAVLSVSSVAVQGANNLDFTTDAASSYAINPGLSETFDVTFGALDVGARAANLVITSDDASSPATIALSGTGLSAIANVSPTSNDFGSVFTGATSGATTITITNDGNQTLDVSSVSLGGSNPGDFGSTASATYSIAPAASETFDVTFSPTAGGSRNAELSIVSNDPASPSTVALSGTGVVPQPPTADVSPVAIDFGTKTVGTTSAAESVTITNTGDLTLDVTGVSVSGDFASDALASYSIAPGNFASFNVTFTPTADGARAGQIDIASNDPGGVASVLLSGQGQQSQPATAALSPTVHDFGTVRMPQSGSPLAVLLTNTGDAVLEVSSVGIGGANAGDFGTDALSSYSIPIGQSVGFNVTFTPTDTGARSASLSVVSNDPNSPAMLALSGTGEDPFPPDAQVSPLSLIFTTVTLPQSSAPQTVTVTNGGEETLNVSNVSFSGANPGDFSSDALASYAIDPTDSVNFDVTFTPTEDGSRTANLVIDSDDPDGSVVVSLSGTGYDPPKASVTPTTHDFGQIVVSNTSGAQTFTVQNIDTVAHNLTAITLSGAHPGDYALSNAPTLPLPMNANDTAMVDAAFAPTTAGARAADVVFEFDNGDFTITAALTGTGVTSVPVTLYRLNAGGNTYVDAASNTWEPDNPYVNTGNKHSSGVAIAGTSDDTLYQSERWDGDNSPELMYTLPVDPGQYTVRLYFAEIYSGTAAVGKRVFDVEVEGQPFLTNFDIFASVGFETATIQETTVQVNDGNLNIEFIHVAENPKVSAIEIVGEVAGAPVLSATPSSIDFGQLDEDVQSSPVTVTLSNVGAVTLQVSDVQITNATGGTFATDALTSYSIPPSSSVNFDVTLTPDSAGVRTASLEITSNDSGSPTTIALTGEGLPVGGPQFTVSPSSVAFGTADVGTSTPSTTVTITNDDTAPHEIHIIETVGTDPNDFIVTSSPALPLTLGPGESTTADVSFAPTAAGARSGELKFHFDSHTYHATGALSGTGENPPPPPPAGDAVYRINVGGSTYIDTLANTWAEDVQYFNTGNIHSSGASIANTIEDTLYQSERWDSETGPEMIYSLPIANGSYDVRLHFAEIYSGAASPGARTFGVLLEGQLALTNYDIFSLVGFETAVIESLPATVSDGELNIEFVHGIENPKLSAIEVITAGGLEPDVSLLEWGHVGIGATGDVMNLTLTNIGDVEVTISSVAFNINQGVGHDFHATIGGSTYAGDHVDISHPVNVVVAVGENVVVPIQFLPTEEGDNDISLVIGGNFGPVSVRLVGTGGEDTGHPFLHVVIVADPYVVDFDGNGSEPVNLVGSFSHTHELSHALTAFEWSENSTIFSTAQDLTTPFNVGDHTVTLTIYDDNLPPEVLSASETFSVVPPTAVPGGIALYFPAGGAGGANVHLDAVPANASFAETLPDGLEIVEQSGTVGGSPFASYVMTQMLATIDIDTAGNYEFFANGGNETRLFLDSVPVSGQTALTPGMYDLDARFAIDYMPELPISVTYAINGGAPMPIDSLMLTHDEAGMNPVINSMPASGLESGGAVINISGLGFFPSNQVTVHWGAQDLSGGSLAVTPTQITMTTPSGTGSVQVTVETPNGVSNTVSYTYNSDGPAPVQFDTSDLVGNLNDVTAGTIGPDGRLYVSEIDGSIFAYTFDEDYQVTDTQTITALEGYSNPNILGMVTSPFEAPGVVKLYVAHSQLFANGGSCFTGFSPYSGQITVLTGPNFNSPQALITGLPVSNHDHSVNGIEFDDNGNLLIAIGGNTNAGISHCNIGGIDESPFTAAVLSANVFRADFNGTVNYVNLSDCMINNDQVFGGSVHVAHGVDIDVFASGFRNHLDMVYTTDARLYATDNGLNSGFGDQSTGPDSQAPVPGNEDDELNYIEVGRYYGSPNRNRGVNDQRQNIYRSPTVAGVPGEFEAPITTFASSTNGLIEYRSAAFNSGMRGELIAQKWNGHTFRVGLSADGAGVTSNNTLFTNFSVLNLVEAPGGVILGIDYTSNKVMKAIPNDVAASGLTVYDIFPWRAPAAGGQEFVISGANFGALGNTSVTIGGVSATLTDVTSKRITGTVPPGTAGPDLLDIVVTVSANSQTLTDAFRYLRTPATDYGAQARFFVDAGDNILESSTFLFGSFNLANESTGGQSITRLRVDNSTAIVPDGVFDPYGTAGDFDYKDFTFDSGQMQVTSSTWFNPHDGGFDVLEIEFDDFGPGELMRFSADMDPTSVKGAPTPGPNNSGSISGLEMTGARIRVEFDDGSVVEGKLFAVDGSDVASSTTAMFEGAPPAPHIEVQGVCSPAVVSNASQTVTITGPPGYGVRILLAESGRYLNGVPGGGFDVEPFEHNTVVDVDYFSTTIGGSGTVDIPITLTKESSEAGYNVISAVLVDAQGNEGPTSQTLVLHLN
jgi:glucose/arabinose dehydrogenase